MQMVSKFEDEKKGGGGVQSIQQTNTEKGKHGGTRSLYGTRKKTIRKERHDFTLGDFANITHGGVQPKKKGA